MLDDDGGGDGGIPTIFYILNGLNLNWTFLGLTGRVTNNDDTPIALHHTRLESKNIRAWQSVVKTFAKTIFH